MPVITEKLEKEASEWIELVTGEPFDRNKTFQENLKDGTLLCKTFNHCFIDFKVKYTHSAMPFKQMENIATFLAALSKLPTFRSFDLFSTVDLYEGKNMGQVTRCVLACKRFAEKETASSNVIRGLENLNIKPSEQIEEIKVEQFEPVEQSEPVEPLEQENALERDDPLEQLSAQENVLEQDEILPQQQDEPHQQYSPIVETDFLDTISDDTAHQQPEVVLIDSPNMADDESEPIVREDEEEYETFTQENPGTFEIQVSN